MKSLFSLIATLILFSHLGKAQVYPPSYTTAQSIYYTQPVSSSSGVTISASTHLKGANAFPFVVLNSAPSTVVACKLGGSVDQCDYTADTSGDLTLTFTPPLSGVVQVGSGGGTALPSGTDCVYNANGSGLSLCSGIILYADDFSKTDPSIAINGCEMALEILGSGTCDAKFFSGSWSPSEKISWGSHNAYTHLSLLLPPAFEWKWSLTDGTSCGIEQFNKTSIRSDSTGGGANSAILDTAGNTTDMGSLYCTDPSPVGGGSYVTVEGLATFNNGGGTLVNAAMNIQQIYDESRFERLTANNASGDAAHFTNICCGSIFENDQFVSAAAGGYPLVVSGGHSMTVIGSTISNPKTGYPNILFQSTAGAFTCDGCYMEGNGATDTTTPMVYVTAGAGPITFNGGNANQQCASSCAKYIFENHSTAGFHEQDIVSSWGGGVNDVASGNTLNTTAGTTLAPYTNALGTTTWGTPTQFLSGTTVIASSATQVPVIVQGAASQSAALQQWKNSSGSVRTDVDSTGDIILNGPYLQGSSTVITSGSSPQGIRIGGTSNCVNFSGDANWYDAIVANLCYNATGILSIGTGAQGSVAGQLAVSGIRSTSSNNTDLDGQLTMSGGTISYTFAQTYTSAPICIAADITAANPVRVQTTTTTLTITGTGTDLVNYICAGRN